MDVHELTAGYALDALDPAERATFEEHLGSCERCRDELQGFWKVSGALAHAAGGPMPPASLRGRILEQARSERSNVVPLRRPRFVVPALSSVAAVAAVAAASTRPRARPSSPRLRPRCRSRLRDSPAIRDATVTDAFRLPP